MEGGRKLAAKSKSRAESVSLVTSRETPNLSVHHTAGDPTQRKGPLHPKKRRIKLCSFFILLVISKCTGPMESTRYIITLRGCKASPATPHESETLPDRVFCHHSLSCFDSFDSC